MKLESSEKLPTSYRMCKLSWLYLHSNKEGIWKIYSQGLRNTGCTLLKKVIVFKTGKNVGNSHEVGERWITRALSENTDCGLWVISHTFSCSCLSPLSMHVFRSRVWQIFSVKGQMVNIWGFLGRIITAATTTTIIIDNT